MHSFRHGIRFLVLVALGAIGPGRLAAKEPGSTLPWKYDLKKGLEEARKTGKRVFLDFTGVACPPCIVNEKKVFPLSEVRKRLDRFVLVKLYTDEVPEEIYPPEARKTLDDDKRQADARPNQQLMFKLGGKGAPFYVAAEPTAENYKEVARYDKGLIRDTKGFLDFLDAGLAPVAPRSTPEALPRTPAAAKLMTVQATVAPKTIRPGQIVKLTITGIPKSGYWTYPLTERTKDQDAAQLARLRITKNNALQPLWPVAESESEFAVDATGKIVKEHDRKFTLTQDILVLPTAKAGETHLTGRVRLVVCDKQRCTPPTEFPFDIPLEISGEPESLSRSLEQRRAETQPPIKVVEVPPDVAKRLGATTAGTEGNGLLAFILQGIFWGAVSLVTPCVFPMIPITVSFFLKQSEKEHHRPLLTAFVYCSTIVIVLTIAAVALLSFFRAVSTHYLMNFGLGALFLFFALSLFGMYEIELPSGLARFTSSREGSGLAGTVFMALTFTIISFACVAPFLGGFGGTAATSKLAFSTILLGGLAFSLTFASPFLILALFPTLLRKLPKSGTWLNSVKVVMGFLELAAALKFCRQGELLITSHTQFFTYDLVLALYVGISLLCGLYLLCFYRLPHDTPLESLSVPRMLFGLAFIALGLYLLPAMWKVNDKGLTQRPNGVVFAWLDSFLLPEPVEDLPWKGDLEKALADAKLSGRRVFVDFTGKTCTNCKYNERNVFTKPAVHELLLKYELLALYTDQVPDEFYTPEEQQEFGGSVSRQSEDARKNLKFQRDQFNTEQLPLYVILEPTGDGKFKEVARYAEGKINNVSAFEAFLRNNLGAAAK